MVNGKKRGFFLPGQAKILQRIKPEQVLLARNIIHLLTTKNVKYFDSLICDTFRCRTVELIFSRLKFSVEGV